MIFANLEQPWRTGVFQNKCRRVSEGFMILENQSCTRILVALIEVTYALLRYKRALLTFKKIWSVLNDAVEYWNSGDFYSGGCQRLTMSVSSSPEHYLCHKTSHSGDRS